MMDIRIRPYARSDFDIVTEIWLESWRSTGVPAKVTPEELRQELRQRWPEELANGWTVHVAERDGEILGFAGLKSGRLEQLFIAPGHQNKGIGKLILDFVKTRMPDGFSLETALESRAPAFYDREGLMRGEAGLPSALGSPDIDLLLAAGMKKDRPSRRDWLIGAAATGIGLACRGEARAEDQRTPTELDRDWLKATLQYAPERARLLALVAGEKNNGPFRTDWGSLQTHKTPDWYAGAKFGIFIHWGL